MAQRHCLGQTVVCADNRGPRLVLDPTICGMNGRCHLPERQNYRTPSTYFSSYPPVHHSRTISKKHPSTSRLRAHACSFGRMKAVLFYSSSNRKLTHTVQLTLEQKPVPGTAVVSQQHCSASFTRSSFSGMQPGYT